MYGGRVGSSLEQHAAPLVDGSMTLVSCNPKRLRAKGEEWIPRYELMVAAPGGEPEEVVLVGRLWAPDQTPPESVTSPSTDADPWTCWLPDLRLELHAEETDDALPALSTLTDPALAARFLEPLIRAAGYTDATIESCETNVVRYKPTSRCTTVVPITYAEGTTGPSPVVLKTHVGDKGSTAWDGHARAVGPSRDVARHRAARRAAGLRRGGEDPRPGTDPGGDDAEGAGPQRHPRG